MDKLAFTVILGLLAEGPVKKYIENENPEEGAIDRIPLGAKVSVIGLMTLIIAMARK